MAELCIYIFFSLVVYHRILNIVLRAIQQYLAVYPFFLFLFFFYRQGSSYTHLQKSPSGSRLMHSFSRED